MLSYIRIAVSKIRILSSSVQKGVIGDLKQPDIKKTEGSLNKA